MDPKSYKALKEEVDKLLDIGFIRESFYLDWLANPILVKKPNGKWRTCIDFINLNKLCPKDSFSLPCIDQLVDTTSSHTLFTFMDAYSSFNQILMYKPNEEHTTFIIDCDLYYFKVMLFGLKNMGVTYQRLVKGMFSKQIGKIIEVYIDDMLVKSKKASNHVVDLRMTFEVLRRYQMKLNPLKCAFGVRSRKFLGYMVNQKGIEANPEKIQMLLNMTSPKKPREVQSLTGRVAALGRFILKAIAKCLPFFNILRGPKIV